MLNQICPLNLGETMPGTDADGNLINATWLGQVFELPATPVDNTQIRGSKKRLVGRTVKVVLLRNESGITLYGKRLAALTATAGYSLLTSVSGYSAANSQKNVVAIDQYLETTGVADDDIFLGIIEGPTIIKTQQTPDATSVIAVGAKLVAGTGAASSQNSLAGGVAADTTPGVDEFIATALSARTTANTNTDLLVNVKILTI